MSQNFTPQSAPKRKKRKQLVIEVAGVDTDGWNYMEGAYGLLCEFGVIGASESK